nr:SDR family oxidoreductase [Vibrio sp. MEBiC08052]
MIDRVKELVPLKRLGTPLELAKVAVFLASDESSYMLGSELLVDGGVVPLQINKRVHRDMLAGFCQLFYMGC